LPKYAWYLKSAEDRPRPPGRLKPNDFGLFDMHGNVNDWCQEWINHMYYGGNPASRESALSKLRHEDEEDTTEVLDVGRYRVMKGGAFSSFPAYCRCAYRNKNSPQLYGTFTGFRLARTLPQA